MNECNVEKIKGLRKQEKIERLKEMVIEQREQIERFKKVVVEQENEIKRLKKE